MQVYPSLNVRVSSSVGSLTDIHGHFDALQRLKREFGYNPIEHQLIYLGDYIDRGPNSCEVVNEIMREALEKEAIALLGNHERMMLNALTSEPNKNRTNDILYWLIDGGQKTLDSYKKNGKRAMRSHPGFLATLPLYAESNGNESSNAEAK